MEHGAKTYLLGEAKRITDGAEVAGRKLTKAEKAHIEDILERVREFDLQAAWFSGDFSKVSKDDVAAFLKGRDADNQMRGQMSPLYTETGYDWQGDPIYSKAGDGFGSTIIAAGWSLKGQPSVSVSAVQALGIKAPTLPDAIDWNQVVVPGIAPLAFDTRFMFRALPIINAEDATAVADFRVVDRTLDEDPNTVVRDLDAVTEKATLDLELEHFVAELRQYAVVLPSIPNAILESIDGARRMFDQEGQRAVENSLDAAVYSAVTASAGSAGSGADIVAQIRNAVGDHRDLGYSPNLLVVSSAVGAELDLFEDAGGLVFATRATGTASPMFSLRVIEAKAAIGQAPLLIDSSRIGATYLGRMRFDANPYSEFSKNLTSLRVETNALPVIRDAGAAVFIDESA